MKALCDKTRLQCINASPFVTWFFFEHTHGLLRDGPGVLTASPSQHYNYRHSVLISRQMLLALSPICFCIKVEFPEARIYEETLNSLLYENREPDTELMKATMSLCLDDNDRDERERVERGVDRLRRK